MFREDDISLSYDPLNQRADFSYNQRGFRTEEAGISYEYDIFGRLVSRTAGADIKSYTYNGFGYLTRIDADGQQPVHLGWNAALGLPSIGWMFQGDEADETSVVDVYVHAPSGELLFRVLPDDTVHFYHYDESGNTIAITDADAEVVAAYGYTPYGISTAQGDPKGNPFTFGGQVGVYKLAPYLYLMRQRVYDARSARFLTPDPILQMDPLKANRYGYAVGNPLRYIDPTGLNPRIAGTEAGDVIGSPSSVVSTLSFISEGIANGFQLGPHFPSGKTPNLIDGIADRAASQLKRTGRLRAKALDYLDARRMLRFYDRGRELSELSQRARSMGAKAGAAGNVATIAGVGLELTDTFFDVADVTTRVAREKTYAHVYHDRSLRRLTRLIKQGRIDTRTAIRRQGQITRLLEDQLDGYEASAEADLFYETGEGLVNSLRAMVPFPLPF
jgi:RHS repeat-associated protein